jgi:SIS domain
VERVLPLSLLVWEISDKIKGASERRAGKPRIDFASSIEKLCQQQSLQAQACSQCLKSLNYAMRSKRRRRHFAHFAASNHRWRKPPMWSIYECLRAGNKLLVCGNGGGATDASHFATELVVRFAKDRRALPAICLTSDSGILTAAGNGFDEMFARQMAAFGVAGDVLMPDHFG